MSMKMNQEFTNSYEIMVLFCLSTIYEQLTLILCFVYEILDNI